MRIAALQTAHERPGLRALDVWEDFGFNVEQLLHLIGEGYFAVFRPEHEALVREYVAEAHKKSIRIILYLNTHLLDPAETARREEWSARDAQGAPRMGYDTYRLGCTNTSWGAILVASARLACRCGVDGIFSDGGEGRPIEGPGNVSVSYEGFAAMLYRSQIPFDVLLEHASAGDMARYECIVMPTAPCLSDETVARLRTYVAEGGNLVACLDAGFFDDAGRPREVCPLADLFGVRFEPGFLAFRTFDYMEVEDRTSGLFDGLSQDLVPAALRAMRVVPESARVLARFHAPMPGRYVDLTAKAGPAVLQNRFGKGRVLYFAGAVGEFYHEYAVAQYAAVVANAARASAALPVRVVGAPESLEVTHRARRDGSADLVHLVNYTGGMSRPISQVVPLHGLRLVCRGLDPVTKATSLATGQILSVMDAGALGVAFESATRVPAWRPPEGGTPNVCLGPGGFGVPASAGPADRRGAEMRVAAFELPVLREYDVIVLEH
jgi:hypothetical protein